MKKLILKTKKISTLSEHFILAEAKNVTQKKIAALSLIQKELTQFFEEQLAALKDNKYNNLIRDPLAVSYKTLVRATKVLSTEIAVATDPTIVASKFKTYIQNIKKYIASTSTNFVTSNAELNNILDSLAQLSQKSALTKQDIEGIKKQIALIQPIISQVEDGTAQLVTKAADIFTDTLTILYGAKNAVDILSNPNSAFDNPETKKSILEFSQAIIDLNGAVATFKLTLTAEVKASNLKEFDTLLDMCQQINTKWLNFAQTNLNKQGSENVKDAAKAKAGSFIDWDEKFKQAVDKDIFWKDYFLEVWGEDAAKVESLGEAFKQECEKIGFSDQVNPFLIFVKTYIIQQKYNILRPSYEALHNAVVDGGLTRADIAGVGRLRANNVIFSRDLYTKRSADIDEYIELQKEIHFNAAKLIRLDPASLQGDALVIAKKLKKKQPNEITLAYNFFFTDLANPKADLIAPGEMNLPLNKTTVIRGWLTSLLGFDNTTQAVVVDSTIAANIVSKVIAGKQADGELFVYALAALMAGKANSRKIKDMIKKPTAVFTVDDVIEKAAELRANGEINFQTAQNMVQNLLKNASYGAAIKA